MAALLTVGQLAKRAEINPKTIRYYESIGLLPEPSRTEAGYRLYDDDALRRLQLIRRAKLVGLSLRETGGLVEFALEGSCGDFRQRLVGIIGPKLAEIHRRIEELKAVKVEFIDLRTQLDSHASGAGEPVSACQPCSCIGDENDRERA